MQKHVRRISYRSETWISWMEYLFQFSIVSQIVIFSREFLATLLGFIQWNKKKRIIQLYLFNRFLLFRLIEFIEFSFKMRLIYKKRIQCKVRKKHFNAYNNMRSIGSLTYIDVYILNELYLCERFILYIYIYYLYWKYFYNLFILLFVIIFVIN